MIAGFISFQFNPGGTVIIMGIQRVTPRILLEHVLPLVLFGVYFILNFFGTDTVSLTAAAAPLCKFASKLAAY